MFAFADLSKIGWTLANADPWWIAGAAFCAIAAYAAMTLSYYGIAAAAGVKMRFAEMLRITLVANTVNYLVSTGGLSGFAVRMYFFTQRQVALGTAVLISFVQTFLTNVALLVLLCVGFVYLLQTHRLTGTAFAAISIVLLLMVTVAALIAFSMLRPKLRRRTLFRAAQAAHWVMYHVLPHRTPPRIHIWRYQHKLGRGIEFLLSRKRQMIGPVLYICLDWAFTALILYSAFLCLNYPVRMSIIIIGFAVGIVSSLISLVPGGLGVMEGSMAAVFAGFGVPFETAVVATLIFRVVYYLFPILVSLFFFHTTFVQGRHATETLQPEDLPPLG